MLKLIKTDCCSYIPIKVITEFWIDENYDNINKLKFRVNKSEIFYVTIKKRHYNRTSNKRKLNNN